MLYPPSAFLRILLSLLFHCRQKSIFKKLITVQALHCITSLILPASVYLASALHTCDFGKARYDLVTKLPSFNGTWKFIIVFIWAYHNTPYFLQLLFPSTPTPHKLSFLLRLSKWNFVCIPSFHRPNSLGLKTYGTIIYMSFISCTQKNMAFWNMPSEIRSINSGHIKCYTTFHRSVQILFLQRHLSLDLSL